MVLLIWGLLEAGNAVEKKADVNPMDSNTLALQTERPEDFIP
jgi:hypothetical protein